MMEVGNAMRWGEGREAMDYVSGKRKFDASCQHIASSTLSTAMVVSLAKRMRAGEMQSLKTLNIVSIFFLVLLFFRGVT